MTGPFAGWLLASCRVVDAPEDLEELVVFAFRNFDGEEEEVEAAVEGLVPLTLADVAALAEG